jgi:AraC-like DNA-binding protein
MALVAGDMLVVGPAVRFRICADEKRPLKLRWFSLYPENLLDLFTLEELPLAREVMDKFSDLRLYSSTTPTATECHKLLREVAPEFSRRQGASLLRIPSLIISAELASTKRTEDLSEVPDGRLRRIVEQLTEDQLIRMPVSQLASKLGYSRRHTLRLFREQYGIPIVAFKMELRLARAVSLLRDRGLAINEVAKRCGFNHRGLFNTCFKRRFGVIPSLWREGQAA